MAQRGSQEKSISDLEKFGADHHDRYSTFWDRFMAGLIDSIALFAILSPIAYFSGFEYGAMPDYLFAFFPYAYSVFLHGRYGRTLGKKIMGLKVIDKSETREIGYRQAFLRESPPLAMIFLLLVGSRWTPMGEYVNQIDTAWFLVEVITVLFNDKRRAVHDFIAGTVVVKA